MAGIWHFPRGNGYGAADFSRCTKRSGCPMVSLSFPVRESWVGTYTPREFRRAIGLYFMAWMMVTIFFGIASIRRHITWILFFIFLKFTYLFFGVSNFSTRSGLPKAAGAFGIITSLIAYYHTLSKLVEGDYAPSGLPLGRIRPSQR
ncbi:GPR1/FUN34/yaaH family-domain-containing protein [Mycena rebaudengoi]|nr:GPR1/FUN34/yaaH family-domain-containing protein [Mycena rebaudengoi]